MGYTHLKLDSKIQQDILNELCHDLSKNYGITQVGPYITLRWKENQVHLVALDIEGKKVKSKIWKCKVGPNKGRSCEYDPVSDPVHDYCIHCGNPEERK